MNQRIKSAPVVACVALAGGLAATPVQAQSQTNHECAPGASQANAVKPYTLTLGLSGYSPVSYIEHNRAEPGSPLFLAEHDGVTYFFTSNAQQRAFEHTPERYLPAYGGYCAFGCSVNAKFVPDPTSFQIINGRTHLFLKSEEVDAKKLWGEADPSMVRTKADAFWASQSQSRAYVNGRNVPASGIGLDGYSPVSYFTSGGPEKGDPAFAVEHNGVTYHLTSPEQVEMFKKNPARYEPQCGGWCAFGMTVEDKFPVDPTKYRVIDDRLYLFLNNDQINAHDLWGRGEQRQLLDKAHAHWKKVSGK